MATRIRWSVPPETLAKAIRRYGDQVVNATYEVAQMTARELEGYAKRHAPWTDRTGNARRGLFAVAEKDPSTIRVFLSHGVDIDYGLFLEVRHGGRFAIIMRAIQAQIPELMRQLERIAR